MRVQVSEKRPASEQKLYGCVVHEILDIYWCSPVSFFPLPVSGCGSTIFYSPNCRVKWVDWLMWRDCLLFRYTSNLSYTKIGFTDDETWAVRARLLGELLNDCHARLTRQVIRICVFAINLPRALYPIPLSPTANMPRVGRALVCQCAWENFLRDADMRLNPGCQSSARSV
jgi:hypothetical protein